MISGESLTSTARNVSMLFICNSRGITRNLFTEMRVSVNFTYNVIEMEQKLKLMFSSLLCNNK